MQVSEMRSYLAGTQYNGFLEWLTCTSDRLAQFKLADADNSGSMDR